MTHTRALQSLRSEADTVFRKLRDVAAPSGTPFEHQSIGYAFGYVEAMSEKGHVEEARDKLDCRSHGEAADVPPRPERGGWM
ncbi:hypothetical protein [Streptomyces sp. NPDC003710]